MEWIKVTDRMPEEKEYFSSGHNFLDGKDRKWSESETVLVVNTAGRYFTDSTKNGTFMSERRRNCDNFVEYVVAWMPIPKYKF